MAITLRLVKGDKLTHQELDDNFTTLQANFTGLLSTDAGNQLTTPLKSWVGTQAAYDAIASPDSNTRYEIIPG